MSNDLQEVQDPQTLHTIGMQIQQTPITQDVNRQWRLYKAWEYSENYEGGHPTWYHVEITDNYQYRLKGLLDSTRGVLYLDVLSILLLVQARIDGAIAEYNAHSSPYYRGM